MYVLSKLKSISLSSCPCKNHAKSEKCDTPKKALHIFVFEIKLFMVLYYEMCNYAFQSVCS